MVSPPARPRSLLSATVSGVRCQFQQPSCILILASQFDSRIFLFTCNDAPSAAREELAAARTRVQDLMDMGVVVEFFPLHFPDQDFSIERFWGELLPVDPTDYLQRAAVRLEDVERVVRMRTHRKRTLQRLAFHLCPGVEASVSVFVTMLEAKVPPPVYLLNENNKPLKAESKQICEQTGALLHPVDDIATYVEVAGHRIFVTRAETQELLCVPVDLSELPNVGDWVQLHVLALLPACEEAKHFGDPSLRVLGFKPLSSLQDHHRMFHAYFVYPNERGFTGSAALLSSLVSVMLERKVLALASYVARRNSEPVLVALLPQAEVEEDGDQRQPPGFHMVRLPWAEDAACQGFPLADGFPAVMPENLKERAQEVVRSLQLPDFVPGCAENPASPVYALGSVSRALCLTVLQKHYAAVQALALSEEQPEETVDVLQPDAAHLETKKPLFLAWKEALDAAAPLRKRAAAEGEGAAKKFPRREAPAVPVDLEAPPLTRGRKGRAMGTCRDEGQSEGLVVSRRPFFAAFAFVAQLRVYGPSFSKGHQPQNPPTPAPPP
ncbi:XRCC6 [Symbiodinium sp. CCMP2456]|nr:XRCC6 [Symbiodinium sp. CCMP2456]